VKPTQIVLMLFLILILAAVACNLPTATSAPPPSPSANPLAATDTIQPAAPGSAATPIPHVLTPGSPPPVTGTPVYDSESASTASLKYAGNGDIYNLNRFERPFTKNDMTYLPYLDIRNFGMSKDPNWYYASFEIENLEDPVKGLEPIYAVEIDYDLNGRGDYLIWAVPPFTTGWDTLPVNIYQDRNHDVGGPHPDKADPSDKAGDGYESIIFNAGQGDDPDLAWVRINPNNKQLIQFAFKKSLIPGNSLEWAAWADAGLKDPAKFAYNDRMSISAAGSPLKGDANYPLKDLFAVDNTCYNPFGTTTGYLPLICPQEEPPPTRKPAPPGVTPSATKRPTLPPKPTATPTLEPIQ